MEGERGLNLWKREVEKHERDVRVEEETRRGREGKSGEGKGRVGRGREGKSGEGKSGEGRWRDEEGEEGGGGTRKERREVEERE